MSTFCLILFSTYVFISMIAYSINYKNKMKGLNGIPTIQCFNPIKWFSVFYGFVLKFLLPKHVFEQYVLRIYDPDCSICIDEGSCVGGVDCGVDCACGCNTLAKMYSPLEKDSGGNWGPIIWNKIKYQKIRESFPVKIEPKYG